MEVLYIPQLDEVDASGEGGANARYRLLKRTPEKNTVLLTDRAVTRVELATNDPVKLVVPPEVKGQVRDFFVRIVITAEEVPEITFASPAGETISFEDADEDVLTCEIGSNVFAFTETDSGIFMVNRKQIDIDVEVEFDPCGGLLDKTKDFVRRAFTVIFVASVVIWVLRTFDFRFTMVSDSGDSMLALIAGFISPIFRPLGFGIGQIGTALFAGFMAKESVVSTLSVLLPGTAITSVISPSAALALLVFCLLYTPCVAAVAVIRRELGRGWAAGIGVWQCAVAWIFAALTRLFFTLVIPL